MKATDVMKFIAVVLGFGLWAYLGYLGKTDLNAMIDLLKVGLGGLIYHMLNAQSDTPVVAPPPAADKPTLHWINPPPGQGGFAGVGLLVLLALMACVMVFALEGCMAIPQQVVDTKKLSDDNTVENLKLLWCNLPIGAVLRHPEIQAYVVQACKPS